jgi:2-polyprenyl-6-methoxyphenol hydroxylase-like FAD-dependent oxidoreductase
MPADRHTAVVVGGGIAGLAAAVALAQADWRVTVLERASALADIGAGLATTGNGMTALSALGLAEAGRAAGYETVTAGFQDQHGDWLMRMPDRPGLRDVLTVWGYQRQRLHAILRQAAQAAGGVELIASAQVSHVSPGEPSGELASVTCQAPAGEQSYRAELVVAADGVRSTVRSALLPQIRPRYSGSTSWRAVVTDDHSDGRLIQAWGPGTEFGALRVSNDEMYWYGYFRNPAGVIFDDELAVARERFANWAPWVGDLVQATTADRLMRHDVYHLPQGPPSYVVGRVAFTGDAAHAALPSSGQGAATALEDGVCVGRLIGAPVQAGGDLAAALTRFDRVRRPRCQQIGRTGRLVARFGADLPGGWRAGVRKALLRVAPAGPLISAGSSIVRWSAPN